MRITIVLNDDLMRHIRLKQSKIINKEVRHVSLSEVINTCLRIGLNLTDDD